MGGEKSTGDEPDGEKAEGETADRPLSLAEIMAWLERIAAEQPATLTDGRWLGKWINIQAHAALQHGFVRHLSRYLQREQEFVQGMKWIVERMPEDGTKDTVLTVIQAAYELGNAVDTTGMIIRKEAQAHEAQQNAEEQSTAAEASSVAKMDADGSAGSLQLQILAEGIADEIERRRRPAGADPEKIAAVEQFIADECEAAGRAAIEGSSLRDKSRWLRNAILWAGQQALRADYDAEREGKKRKCLKIPADEYAGNLNKFASVMDTLLSSPDEAVHKDVALLAVTRAFQIAADADMRLDIGWTEMAAVRAARELPDEMKIDIRRLADCERRNQKVALGDAAIAKLIMPLVDKLLAAANQDEISGIWKPVNQADTQEKRLRRVVEIIKQDGKD